MKIQYVLESGVVSRGWVEQLERIREKRGMGRAVSNRRRNR